MFKKCLFLGLLVSNVAACTCLKSTSGKNSSDQYSNERDAVCLATPALCDRKYMASVPVYETDQNEVEIECGSGIVGCFYCGFGCSGSIVLVDADIPLKCAAVHPDNIGCFYTQSQIMLHEYTHALFESAGMNTEDHPPEFGAALSRANVIFNNRMELQQD